MPVRWSALTVCAHGLRSFSLWERGKREDDTVMRIAYFDCFAGISGDMTLGALVDAGVDLACLREELAKLPVSGYSLAARVVKRGGFRGTKVNVIVDEKAQPPRRYTDIVAMISDSTLEAAIKKGALDIFRRLGD